MRGLAVIFKNKFAIISIIQVLAKAKQRAHKSLKMALNPKPTKKRVIVINIGYSIK